MNPIYKAAFGGLVCFGAVPAMASSIVAGDAYVFEISEGGISAGSINVTEDSTDQDVEENDFQSIGSFTILTVDFVDGDSFEVSLLLSGASDLAYTLSALDFADSFSNPEMIVGASFNRAESSVDEFLFDPDFNPFGPPASEFVEPVVTFTGSSVTATFSAFSDLLGADGITLRYDLVLAGENGGPTDAIPLPASGLLLLGALGLFAGTARRR